ncbi:uncharacterized protein B0H18DRAFT_1036795 [Fomitopsis serialis]|uniref:uncharacterized protein n=1 Tax=Fomitopsis serialis TaxID=139415 RepID=UPI002007F5D4|nr:uncharacterized protein B0H18DRAFT_1036795 [Neoantrodia serialis]KAH9916889.1 hypothetical protein B0H18DRAFT_1036795 [Neoantrodia serialis]
MVGPPFGSLGLQASARRPRPTSNCARGLPLPLRRASDTHLFPNIEKLHFHDEHNPRDFTPQKWAWPVSMPLVNLTASLDQLQCFAGVSVRRLYLHWQRACKVVGLSSALLSIRPLLLSVQLSQFDKLEGLSVWAGLLCDIVGPVGRLRHLEVTFQCNTSKRGRLMPCTWMEWLLPVIAQSSLVGVRLGFAVGSTTTSELDEMQKSAPDIARQVAARVASLQYVCVAMGPRSYDPRQYHRRVLEGCTWWRVRGDAGQRCVESMSNESGERVESYMRSADFERKLSLDGFILPGT